MSPTIHRKVDTDSFFSRVDRLLHGIQAELPCAQQARLGERTF